MGTVFINTVLKCIIVYGLALVLSRLIGTKLIYKMNFFDFVTGVSMGSMIANAVIDKDSATFSEITALIIFSLLTIVISFLSMKSFVIRRVVSSESIVLVENGMILDKNLKKIRITVNELFMKLREKDVFNLSDVEYAIMERNGIISVLVKADKKPVTPYDMNIKTKSGGLLKDIIIDGNIIEKNLKLAGIDKKWLEAKLKSNKIENISEVFYAGIDKNKELNISKRTLNNIKSQDGFGIE